MVTIPSPARAALFSALVGASFVAPLGCGAGSDARPAAVLQDARPLCFTDVAVFTGLSDGLTPHQDVCIDGEVITRVSPAGEAPLGEGVVEIAGGGRALLPGFIDVHTHFGSSSAPPWLTVLPDDRLNASKYLYAGITTAFDVGGQLEALAQLKAALKSGEVAGPDLYFAGPHLALKGGHPQALIEIILPWPLYRVLQDHWTFAVEDEADVDDAVARIRAAGGDLVKVTVDEIPLGKPFLGPELLGYAVKVAHDAGFKVAAHIGSEANALEAVDAGVDYLLHGVYRDTLSPEGAGRIAAAGVAVAPTIGVFHTIDKLASGEWAPGPFQEELTDPAVLEAIRNPPEDSRVEGTESWLEAIHAHRQDRLTNTALLAAKGVTLLVGSDSPTLAHEAGVAYHTELELLVEAGLPPGGVLRRATAVNAATFGLTDRGTIEVGKRADLVLVQGDPTADIAAAHAIQEVIRAGKRVTRQRPYELSGG